MQHFRYLIFLVVHNVEQWDNTLYVAFYRLTLLKAHTSILSYSKVMENHLPLTRVL